MMRALFNRGVYVVKKTESKLGTTNSKSYEDHLRFSISTYES